MLGQCFRPRPVSPPELWPRKFKNGSVRWYAIYLAPDGRRTSEGGFDTTREVELAHRRVMEIEGHWVDPSRNKMALSEYVERHFWPPRATWS